MQAYTSQHYIGPSGQWGMMAETVWQDFLQVRHLSFECLEEVCRLCSYFIIVVHRAWPPVHEGGT